LEIKNIEYSIFKLKKNIGVSLTDIKNSLKGNNNNSPELVTNERHPGTKAGWDETGRENWFFMR